MIRDSVIFDFYTAKGVHEQEAKRIANTAWRSGWRKSLRILRGGT